MAPLISSAFSHFMLILGAVGFVSFILTFKLKETRGLEMTDLID